MYIESKEGFLSKEEVRGLGDVIHNITYITGIQSVVNKVSKGKCGCANRRKKLNESFPINSKN